MPDRVSDLEQRVARLEQQVAFLTGYGERTPFVPQEQITPTPPRVAQPNYAALGLGSAEEAEGMN